MRTQPQTSLNLPAFLSLVGSFFSSNTGLFDGLMKVEDLGTRLDGLVYDAFDLQAMLDHP